MPGLPPSRPRRSFALSAPAPCWSYRAPLRPARHLAHNPAMSAPVLNLARLVDRAARRDGARPAVFLDTDPVHDYTGLARRTAALAGALREGMGLAPGERVALFMRNHPAVVEILFACWHAGLIAVPVNAKLHARELAFVLAHSGARLCIATPDTVKDAAAAAEEAGTRARVVDASSRDYAALTARGAIAMVETAASDVAWLFYTSGTTGRPKGAMLTHRNLMTMALAYFADVDAIAPEDAVLHAAPMSHGSGMYILPHVAAGAAQVVPSAERFEPGAILDLVRHHPGTTIFAAPTMVKRLVEHPGTAGADLTNLKTVVYGGGPMYLADMRRALAAMGNRFVQIYGQGESPMTITALARRHHADTAHPRYMERLASVGTAYGAVEVRVADAEDRALPAGETGEVLVRGDTVMRGYWNDGAASA
ncbi:MAG: long-chain fatty acid--CoA ligase, partial [Alphaproteobacteria bacterium]|nr:long-chain fatty acid--CoA ligase [Alphaproteobacteria bacterium]